jgi:hypothetical protein
MGKPLRRDARLLPGLRLRCCDKAVLPLAKHAELDAQSQTSPTLGSAPLWPSCQYGPRKRTRRESADMTAWHHRRYLARSGGVALTASTKKLCRYSRQHCGVDHKLTTRTVTITRCNNPLSCDHCRDSTKLLTTRRRSTGKAASASLCATAQPTCGSGGLSPGWRERPPLLLPAATLVRG